jgi:predicted NAD-dependent protein-ADP-ribosyltransferase YbiA (DUF1768 family)
MSSDNKNYNNEKDYDTSRVIFIGNYKNYKGKYQNEVLNFSFLSPYYKHKITYKNKEYPSLINYLYSFRLCYKDLKEKILSTSPEDVVDFYKKNKNRCDKVITMVGEKMGKGKFESVNNFLVKTTSDALNILYTVFMNDNTLKSVLIDTEYLDIVFVDEDKILGNGFDGSGLNLLGKKMQEVRKYLKSTTMSRANVYNKLEMLSNIKLNFDTSKKYLEYKNEKFNHIEKWAYKMMLIYSYCVAKFFNYLCEPREYYMPIIKGDNIDITDQDDYFILKGEYISFASKFKEMGGTIKKKEWRFPMKQKKDVLKILYANEAMGIQPIVNVNITNYVINEIFHCSFKDVYSNLYFPDSENISTTISSLIKTFIDEELVETVSVTPQTTSAIWKHICKLCEQVYDNVDESTDDKDVVLMSQDSVNTSKREYSDNGMMTELENCAVQSVLYTIIALMDWLALDEVTDVEVDTCIDMLSFNMPVMKRYVDMKMPASIEDTLINVINAFYKKGFTMNEKVGIRLLKFVLYVSELAERDNGVLNRIMFFSNII